MNDPIGMEIGALAARANNAAAKRQRAFERVARALGFQDHYRRCFCDEDGNLSESGMAVLRDIAKQANFGASHVGASDAELRSNNAMRHIVLHIFARLALGSEDLLLMQQRMRGSNHE